MWTEYTAIKRDSSLGEEKFSLKSNKKSSIRNGSSVFANEKPITLTTPKEMCASGMLALKLPT
jgi:hypothetical protein